MGAVCPRGGVQELRCTCRRTGRGEGPWREPFGVLSLLAAAHGRRQLRGRHYRGELRLWSDRQAEFIRRLSRQGPLGPRAPEPPDRRGETANSQGEAEL